MIPATPAPELPINVDLVAATERLLEAVTTYGRPPHDYDPQADRAGRFYPTAADFAAVRVQYDVVLGLATAAGLPVPPPLEQAGLPVYDHFQVDQHVGYLATQQPNGAARERYETILRSLHTAARAWQAARAAQPAALAVAATVSLGRLRFDAGTQTVLLDGSGIKVADPKAFAVYRALAEACPQPLTRAAIQKQVPGCRGAKKIRQLLDSLAERLRATSV